MPTSAVSALRSSYRRLQDNNRHVTAAVSQSPVSATVGDAASTSDPAAAAAAAAAADAGDVTCPLNITPTRDALFAAVINSQVN